MCRLRLRHKNINGDFELRPKRLGGVTQQPIAEILHIEPITLNDRLWRIFGESFFHARLLTQHKSRSFPRDNFLHVDAEFTQTWFHVVDCDSSIASLIASATPSGLIENASMAFESRTTVGFFSPSIRCRPTS